MRPGALGLAAALTVAAAVPLQADEWTRIDVTTRLANDGRVTVAETHHIVFATTGRSVSHDFGLGADQAIALTAVTRIGPDGEPHRLKAVETVAGPDEYRYYDRGHAYFSVPALGEAVPLTYRFEYGLVGGVAPSWAIAAGPGSRAAGELEFQWPWYRAGEILADWRRPWPVLATRYRFDHEILLPDREGSGNVFRQIDYRLEYDSAWREVDKSQPVGAATGHGAYRAFVLFDYLAPGAPPHATTMPAAMRLAAIAALPVIGTAGWLLVIGAARLRRGPPIDRTFVDSRFLSRAPEEIAFWLDDRRPVVADVLARLAGEAAISIHVDRPAGHVFAGDTEAAPQPLHMRRIAADAALTSFDLALIEDIFGDARELTTESHERRHAGRDYDPDDVLERRLRDATLVKRGSAPGTAAPGGRPWSLARIGLALVFVVGLFGVFRNTGPLSDIVPILAVWAFFTVALVNGWPTGWWYHGRPVRGLLVPLVVLYLMQLSMLLIPNRPMPAEGWLAAALAALAGYFLTLTRSRMPGGHGGIVGDLLLMRAYAAAELKRPRPQLDDRWIPRLRAFGLGPAIDAWRARHSGASAMPPDHSDRPVITTAHFTGMAAAPWAGPPGWADGLRVYDDSEEEDEEDEDEDAADDDPHGDDPHGTGKA